MHHPVRLLARSCLPVLVSALLLGVGPARGGFVVSVQSVEVFPSTTGNALEVTLTNDGPTAVAIGSFSFEIASDPAVITFTSATTSTTAPYIFAGHSLFGPVINTSAGATLLASDLDDRPAGATVAAGATVGLGRVLFNVGFRAGTFPVTLSGFPNTSLSDPTGANLVITQMKNGTIGAVPEPSSLALLALGWLAVAGSWRSRIQGVTRREPQRSRSAS